MDLPTIHNLAVCEHSIRNCSYPHITQMTKICSVDVISESYPRP